MKYLIRSAKYFLKLTIILVLIIVILSMTRLIDSDISKMFVNGYDSLWQIAILMAVFSLVYPRFGYMRRNAIVPGSFDEVLPIVMSAMERLGYERESLEGENLTFRKRGIGPRIVRSWEDRISLERMVSGFEVEGLGKDVMRVKYALEDGLRTE